MKFATKTIRHYPPHLRHVATLPWEIENLNFLQIFSRYERKCKQTAFKCTDFYRATACNATHGIAVAILSICPSDACIVTKLNNALRIF